MFQNKTAVVTGAGGTLCSAIAIELAKQGANVVLVGRTKEKLDVVYEKIQAAGGVAFVTDGTESGVNGQEIDMADLDNHPYSSLLIDINTSTMASMPPECVQTLRLKVSPHTIKNGND